MSNVRRTKAQNKFLAICGALTPLATLCALAISFSAQAQPSSQNDPSPVAENPPQHKAQDKKQGDEKFRNFYQVMDDLLADFEYDLKNGQVQGLKDVAIRNVALSENVPPSFKNHLELVVTEKILQQTKSRVIQCLPCRARRTTVNGDQVVISSNDKNPAELSRIAKLSGISHFLDMAFSYQPSGMVLSMYTLDPETGAVIWSRSYNSETSRSSAFRRGVDYTQIEEARKASEYQPTLQSRAILYYLFERNISGYTGCIGLGYRLVERYDNRHKEVGFEVDYLRDASSIAGSSATTSTNNLYTGMNLTMLFVHSWNLIGAEENYNVVRGNVFAGIGGTYSSGFLGGLIRTGYEWRLAKHWAVSANLGYRPPATPFIAGSPAGKVSGAEIGIGVSGLF